MDGAPLRGVLIYERSAENSQACLRRRPRELVLQNQLLADGGLVTIQQLGYLSLILFSFHEGVNLISFSLAELFVFHKQL